MNKRIRELYDQCIVGRNNDAQWIFEGDLDAEQFAELLIRECCEQVEQAKHSPFVSLDDAKRMQHFVNVTKKKINKHFGVEE